MNKAEFKAISIIADKLNWQNKPVMEVCETINQMVRNQQALELDTVGECNAFEETLLSIALWDKDNLISTMYVSDYTSLVMWDVELFKEDMGLDSEALTALFNWEACKMNFLAPEYEAEDDFARFMANDNTADWVDFEFAMNMGWC
jgi:hypothetical protein